MPTITDVAKLAGVSAGTVSRVLNGADNVRPDTQRRVAQAIAQLDYQPNFQARSLRSKRTYAIALAIPELTNYYWTTVARGVQDATQAQGYQVFICNTRSPHHNHLQYLEMMLSRIDGIILTRQSERILVTPANDDGAEPLGSTPRIPAVYIDRSRAANWNIDSVYSDSISGAFALTQHLIGLGHRKIAIVTGRETSSSAVERVAGYCMALRDARIPIDPSMICWGEYHRKQAKQLTHQLMGHLSGITAIVAANNEISIGVMHALEQWQLRVPEDVAVVCFNDFYPDSRFASTMTCVDVSPYDLGVNAVQILFNRMDSEDYLRPRSVALPTRMIVRQSCGGGQIIARDEDRRADRVTGQLSPTLSAEKIAALLPEIRRFVEIELPANDGHFTRKNRSDAHLRSALRRKSEANTAIPHFAYAITTKWLYSYILEREPLYETIYKRPRIAIEDQFELARRTGMAAVPCRFPWQPTSVQVGSNHSGKLPPDFPSLIDQLNFFDRCTRAARNSTVGVAADFGVLVVDETAASSENSIEDETFGYQSKVTQLICDRFAAELSFAMVELQIAGQGQLDYASADLRALIAHRLRDLLHPVFEHQLPTVVAMPGRLEGAMPLMHELGVDAVCPLNPELNDLAVLKSTWNGKLSFVGGVPRSWLFSRDAREIEQRIVELGERLAQGGGYVLGISGEIGDDVPPQGVLAMLRAAQRLG